MKVGEYGVKIHGNLITLDGDPLDLTDATDILLILKLKGEVYEKDVTVLDETEGRIEYIVEEGLLSAPGTLIMEVNVDYGATERYKNKGIVKETVEKTYRPEEITP